MSAPGKVVTFGELLLRLSPARGGFLESATFSANLGGCEANVAVSLAHLGVPVTYVTALPDNPLGRAALGLLRAEGVEVHSLQVPNSRLGLFFVDLGGPPPSRAPVTVYDRAHSAFAGIEAATFPWAELLAGASWLHCSGITPALGAGPLAALEAALAAARTTGVQVSLDLNYRPTLWAGRKPGAVLGPLVRNLDLLIGTAAALEAMLGLQSRDPRAIARETGARRVALTRRVVHPDGIHEWSASLFDAAADTEASSRVYRVRAVDRVGGGDSFAAALLAALLGGRAPEQALTLAVVSGAYKLGVPGDFNRIGRDALERLVASPDPAWS